jgi:hypothetical protein
MPLPQDLRVAVCALADQYRSTCLRFPRPDYYPTTADGMLRVLGHVRRHGDRSAFLRARELEQWLLRHGSVTSADSSP